MCEAEARKIKTIEYEYGKAIYQYCPEKDDIDIGYNFYINMYLFLRTQVSLTNSIMEVSMELLKLLHDLSVDDGIGCFDEVGENVFTRKLGVEDVIVRIKICRNTVKIIGFYRQSPYDSRCYS